METEGSAELAARIRAINERFEHFAGRLAEAYATLPEGEDVYAIDATVSRERHG